MRIFRYVYRLHGPWVQTGIIHTGGHGGGCGIKILHLFRHESHVPHIFRQLDSLLHGASRMGRHEIWHCILFFTGARIGLFKILQKLLIHSMFRLAHIGKHLVGNVFRCHPQLSAYMILGKLLQKFPVPVCFHIVKTDSGAYKHFLNLWYLPQFSQ